MRVQQWYLSGHPVAKADLEWLFRVAEAAEKAQVFLSTTTPEGYELVAAFAEEGEPEKPRGEQVSPGPADDMRSLGIRKPLLAPDKCAHPTVRGVSGDAAYNGKNLMNFRMWLCTDCGLPFTMSVLADSLYNLALAMGRDGMP
jgi:hypothetical protein